MPKDPTKSDNNKKGSFQSITQGIRNLLFLTTEEAEIAQRNNKLMLSIDDVLNNDRSISGENTSSFLNKAIFGAADNKGQTKKDTSGNLVKINDLINDGQFSSVVNDVFFSEREKFQLMDDYQRIAEYIPEVGIIIDTYKENILSPESIDRDKIVYNYNDPSNPEFSKEVNTKIASIIEEHNLEQDVASYVADQVKYGKGYVAIVNMTEYTNGVLKEGENISLNNEYLTESMSLVESDFSTLAQDNDTKKLVESYMSIIQAENTSISLHKLQPKLHESKIEPNTITDKDFAKKVGKYAEEMFNIKSTNEFFDSVKKSGKSQVEKLAIVPGTIVYKLDTKKIVKISTKNDQCLGYYYIEHDNSRSYGSYASASKGGAMGIYGDLISSQNLTSFSSEQLIDAKTRIISEIFTKRIAKKLNRQFIADNAQFKEIIFGLLKNRDNTEKMYSVVYLPPEAVVEFGTNTESVLKNIIFVGKLYLACLLSNFMQRIVQGPDKRIFYMDMGLDTDIPGAINNFAKNLKSKDFRMQHLDNISSVFNRIGSNSDIYIPTVNGQKPIDVEMLPSKEIAYNDDFLTYLKNMIFTGSGIPNEMLTQKDSVDFAQSLAMRNARFVRRILPMQADAGRAIKELILKIMQSNNKYIIKTDDTSDDFDKRFNEKYLSVELVKPLTLMAQMYSDKISTFGTYADFITATVTGETDVSSETYIAFKRDVIYDHMKEIDWAKFEKLYEQTQYKIKQKKLDALAVSNSVDNTSMNPNTDAPVDDATQDQTTQSDDSSATEDDDGLGL